MSRICFVTGGARSGKSSYAQQRCEALAGDLLYVATARIEDEEMAARVERHRQMRGRRWTCLEEPSDLVGCLPKAADGKAAVLVDCLTLWLSNRQFHLPDEESVWQDVYRLLDMFKTLSVPLFLVSNELGSATVPDHPLARAFRDLAGLVNQKVAAAADEAWLVVSGLPLRLK